MEQQVNLYQPILGAEKRLFSARAIGMGSCFSRRASQSRRLRRLAYGRVERSIAAAREHSRRRSSPRSSGPARLCGPGKSLAELDTEAKELSADIAARERALDLVRLGAASPETGFAARLEALARRQPEGLWLHNVVMGSGEGRLALRGNAARSPQLVPAYLAPSPSEHASTGVRFDKLVMRRANPEEAPAAARVRAGRARPQRYRRRKRLIHDRDSR